MYDESPPRLLLTRFPMGRPLGAPGYADQQRAVLTAALNLLETAEDAGTVVEWEGAFRSSCGE